MIEALFELLLQVVIEIVGEVLFQLLVSLGWESVRDSTERERPLPPVFVSIGQFFLGLCSGVVSLIVVGHRLSPQSPWPGVSLLLAPLGTGLVMQRLGDLWVERGKARPALLSFRAGAVFAFGMALARFAYIELQWRPF